jgi:hypothetical protein
MTASMWKMLELSTAEHGGAASSFTDLMQKELIQDSLIRYAHICGWHVVRSCRQNARVCLQGMQGFPI